MKTRVMLADDHQMFRQALSLMLSGDQNIEIVAEVSDGVEMLKVAFEKKPDVVVIDVNMPNLNGIEATRLLLKRHPEMKVIGLSASTDRDFVLDMMKAGASGYVTKNDACDELLRAFKVVLSNRKYFCPAVSGLVMESMVDISAGGSNANRLGSRERQVLQMVAEGLSSAEIADHLHLASSTIEVHRRNIMRKLNLHSVADLTKYAIRKGLTSV